MFESVIVSLSREINLVVLSALFVTLFLGGYDLLPGMWWLSSKLEILYYPMQFFSLLIKVVIMTVIIQISSISLIKVKLSSQIKFFWHHLIPLGIINLMLVVGMIIIRSTI
ncbi:MAG: hypothetical protein HN623_07210 [Bdellovibrionales bacterium]|nr:hypothetical protein [Bdellovibrionales bacterium]